MPIIEGVGDEVTIFVTILFILTGLLLAWLTTTLNPSTSVSETVIETTSDSVDENAPAPASASDNSQEGEHGHPSGEGEHGTESPPAPVNDSGLRNDSSSATPSDSTSDTPPGPSDRIDGHIRLKIKYLDERERYVQVRPDENIESFKRIHFAGELAENLLVRLIYNGQELRGDNSTLSSYNIGDMSVVHCLITRSVRPQEVNGQNDQESMEIDLSNLMFPLFGLILGLIWYCRIAYRNFFNAMSTLALIGITVLFCFACVITFRNNRLQDHFMPAPPPAPAEHPHQE